MSYGQGGYRQPDLRPGMPVQTDTGWEGQVVEVIPAPPGYDGTVRVAWRGYGTTDVLLSTFSVENGVAWIRSQPPAQQQAPQPAVQHTMPLDTMPDDDMATQLAGPVRQPVLQEPTHVNPYAGNEPLIADEPAAVHTAGREQDMGHVNPLMVDQPVVAPEPPPVHPAGGRQVDPDATILPSGRSDAPASGDYQPPYDDQSDATILARPVTPAAPEPMSDETILARPMTPDSAETVLSRPATPAAPAMPTSPVETPGVLPGHAEPDAVPEAALASTGVEPAASELVAVTPVEQREVTVPVIEEQVAARAEWRDAGAITVRTVMDEIPQTLSHETQRDEVFVERVTVGRVLAEGEEVAQREEDGVTIIPVIVEEAVVVTRRVLAEELHITKRTIPAVQTVQTVVRKERVEIDAGELADRVHDSTGTDAANIPPQAARGDDTA
jgi:uncharacterized protein (TIGR02271 family)